MFTKFDYVYANYSYSLALRKYFGFNKHVYESLETSVLSMNVTKEEGSIIGLPFP
jgi:hypothetical protein